MSDEKNRKSSPATTDRSVEDVILLRSSLRPIHEWFLYVGILCLLLSMVLGPLMVIALKSDNSGISIIILVIFLGALGKSFWNIRYLDKQIHLANEQISHLGEIKNILHFLQSTERSLLREHVSNLFTIFKRDVSIQQDNLVSLLQMRLLSQTKLVGFCSNILVTLGLVGTIVGLISSASGLGTVMESVGEDHNALLEGMQKTVHGMGTAFYTTLLGAALGGVVLRLLVNLIDTNVDLLVSRIAEICEIYVLPVLRRAARFTEKKEQAKLISHLKAEKRKDSLSDGNLRSSDKHNSI